MLQGYSDEQKNNVYIAISKLDSTVTVGRFLYYGRPVCDFWFFPSY